MTDLEMTSTTTIQSNERPKRCPRFSHKGMESYEPMMRDMIALWRELKDYHRSLSMPKITRMNDFLVLEGIWLAGNASQQLTKVAYPATQRSLIWLYTQFRDLALRYNLKPVIIGKYFFNALIADRLADMRKDQKHEHDFYRARHPDLIKALSILPFKRTDAVYVIAGVRY